MNIKLYKCSDDPNKINKTLSNEKTVACQITMGCPVCSPEIYIDTFVDYSTYNYCYIPDFNRYYFINEMTPQDAQHITLSLGVDVLYTYKDIILNHEFLILRNENQTDTKIVDNSYPLKVNKQFEQFETEGGLMVTNDTTFVIGVI